MIVDKRKRNTSKTAEQERKMCVYEDMAWEGRRMGNIFCGMSYNLFTQVMFFIKIFCFTRAQIEIFTKLQHKKQKNKINMAKMPHGMHPKYIFKYALYQQNITNCN